MKLSLGWLAVLPVVPLMAFLATACRSGFAVEPVGDEAGAGAEPVGERVGKCTVPADGGCWGSVYYGRPEKPNHGLECVDFDTGIYGSATYSCATHCPPSYGGCFTGAVSVTDVASQKTTMAELRGGLFLAPLEPGTYDVCFDGFFKRCSRDCVRVNLAQNEVRGIKVADVRAGTGYISCTVSCNPGGDCTKDAGAD